MELAWTVFEIVGTIAFAISGALVGIGRRMDIFGLIVLALATAIGGGILRDVLVGHLPPNSLKTASYVVLTIAVTFAVFFVYRSRSSQQLTSQWVRRTYLLADTFGLGAFTVTGTSVGVYSYPTLPVFCVILGLLTAIGGGIIRDILAQRVPSVLKEDVYALPSIIGSVIYYCFAVNGEWIIGTYTAFIVAVMIRLLAIRYAWSLPRIR